MWCLFTDITHEKKKRMLFICAETPPEPVKHLTLTMDLCPDRMNQRDKWGSLPWVMVFQVKGEEPLPFFSIVSVYVKKPWYTHFSRPSPTTAILLLSSVQAMSLILPETGVYSYLSRCSFWVVSQMRILPDASKEFQINHVIRVTKTLQAQVN